MFNKLSLMLLSLLLGFGSEAMATVTCKAESGYSVSLAAKSVPILADMPIGTVVYSQSISGIVLKCARETLTGLNKDNQVMLLVPDQTKSTLATTKLGLTAYINYNGVRTNTATAIDTGIDGSAFPATGLLGIGLVEVIVPGEVVVEFVKSTTSPVSMPLVTDTFNPFGFSNVNGNASDAPVYITGIKSGFAFPTQTCDVQVDGSADRTVTLPTISTTQMGGIGGTYGEANFELRMLCLSSTPIPGTFKALLALSGTTVAGAPGVLVNTGTATGIGIRINDLRTGSAAAINGGAQVVGSYVNNIPIEVPFSASYYQTENQVGSGSVRSVMSYTLTYQ